MAVPPLSLVMSVYNNAPYVGAAIDSILAQSFTDFEFLIVDDGSTDGSGEIIAARAAGDARIRMIRQTNRGFVASLNRLFAEAKSRWVARMDGDDLSHPERLARQMKFLDANPKVGVVSCEARLIGPDGAELTDKPRRPRPLDHSAIVVDMEAGVALNHNAAVIDGHLVARIGGYRPAYRHCEDYDLWLRLAPLANFANLAEPLIDYRLYPEQVSNRHLVEQARNAAIAWLAHQARQRGMDDPTVGLESLPSCDMLDELFGQQGAARYVRSKVVNRMLFSPEALGGDGYRILVNHIADTGAEPRLWRAAVRLAMAGRPGRAVGVVRALIRAA